MDKFHFDSNGFKNICHVYKDSLCSLPFDTLSLTEVDANDTTKKIWIPQSNKMQKMILDTSSIPQEEEYKEIESIKDFYNENHDKICDIFFPDENIKDDGKINGFYFDRRLGQTHQILNTTTKKNKVLITKKEKQAIGLSALAELSFILPEYNKGWEPNWCEDSAKICIRTVGNRVGIETGFNFHHVLAFKTKQKAELFLKEQDPIVDALFKAGYI